MDEKLYAEWLKFVDTEECENTTMDGSVCYCKFNNVCDKFESIRYEINSVEGEVLEEVMLITKEEYDRLKEIEYMYNDLCR